MREEPGGRLRVTCGKHAADTLVWPAFSRLIAAHPGIDGELSVEDRYVDIVAERFDVGIRMRDNLEMDMIFVPVGPPLRTVVVAAPGISKPTLPQAPRAKYPDIAASAFETQAAPCRLGHSKRMATPRR